MRRVGRVRIIADDLTGALDAAAPFAAALGPLPVIWDWRRVPAGSFALDAESREAETGALAAALPSLAEAGIAFKKIDSLLRGRTAEEIAFCLQSGLFASAVIAPAFPAQNRITRGGRQYWRKAPDEPWEAVACDLVAALGSHGVALRPARRGADLAAAGFFVCDAEHDRDLASIVTAGSAIEKPVLWVGTAGLARAMAGEAKVMTPRRPERPLLAVVGSHHPVSLGQVEVLAERRAAPVIVLQIGEDAGRAVESVADALEEHASAVLVLSAPDGTGATVAAPWFRAVLSQVAHATRPPASLIATGGATLMQLVRALDAQALEVQGELVPGIPLSVVQGGRWPGAMVVSKSGAFGEPELLARLIEP